MQHEQPVYQDQSLYQKARAVPKPLKNSSFGENGQSTRKISMSIIIPAYNEEEALGNVLKELEQHLESSQQVEEYEIIVVDDGSSDDTFNVASKANTKVVKHEFNKGYGAALKTGIRIAKGDFVIFFDADGQHDPQDISRLLAYFPEYDMVVGERTKNSHRVLLRRPGKKFLSLFANFLAGTKIPDLNSGFRAFKKEVLLKYVHLFPSGFSFSTTSTFAFLKSNRRIKYVPIATKERIGKSSVKQFRHGFQTLLLMLRLIVLFEPLKVFLSTSIFLFLLCSASATLDILDNAQGIADTTVLLAISSILIFFFGLLADQISAMRREKHE